MSPPPARPVRCLAAALVAFPVAVSAAVSASTRFEPESCRGSDLREDHLESFGPRGELVMASGLRATLTGIHWPETESGAARAEAFLRAFRGRGLTVSREGDEDRWGRARIEAVADPDSEAGEPVDLAAGLVAAGLAHADAGESSLLCRADLLALEAEPRAARRGIWGEGVMDAGDGPALAARVGHFVVVEGRILGVGERAERTYLDFARAPADGLTVTVSKRTWRIMRERGLTAATLKGRLARVRGRVETRRGPVLDIASASMIEVIEGSGR